MTLAISVALFQCSPSDASMVSVSPNRSVSAQQVLSISQRLSLLTPFQQRQRLKIDQLGMPMLFDFRKQRRALLSSVSSS